MQNPETRRTFLSQAAPAVTVVGSISVLVDCAPVPEVGEKKYPSEELIFRAGTILITGNTPTGPETSQGALIRYKDAYHIYTIQHIVRKLQNAQGTVMYFPGLARNEPFDPKKFQYIKNPKNENELERGALYTLSPDFAKYLDEEIKQGNFTSLELTNQHPQNGEQVVMPDFEAQKYTQSEILRYNAELNLFVLSGRVCEGNSGAPVLKKDKGKTTNIVYGVVSSGNENTKLTDDLGRTCTDVSFFRPTV